MARLLDLSRTLTDEILDMHDRLMVSLIRAGEQAALLAYQVQGPSVVEQLGQYQQVMRAIVLARELQRDSYQAIEAILPWEDLVHQVGSPDKPVSVLQLDPLWEVIQRYPKVRSYAQRLLTAFTFKGKGSAAPLVKAIDLLRERYVSNKRTLPEDVPLSFIQPHVVRNAKLDRKAYELCVLDELRLALRSGDLWVAGSHKYRDLDAYLLPQMVWPQRLKELPLTLPETFDAFWEETEPALTRQLQEVAGLLAQGELSSISLLKGELRIGKPLKAGPDGVDALQVSLAARLSRIKITDLLLEVNAWGRFTNVFLDLRNGKGVDRHDHLLTGILVDALNLG